MVFSLHHLQLFHSPTRFSSQPKSTTNHPLISLKLPTRLSNNPLAFAQNAATSHIDSEKAALLPPPLRKELMPNHVAVIMDGNRRWAKMKGLPIALGYEAGVRALKNLVQLCCDWRISVLTVFAFSSQNWFRPKMEVDFLMGLFERGLKNELEDFVRAGIRMSIIGDSSKLPKSLQDLIDKAVKTTKENSRLHLVVAVNYSGQYDVVQACQNIAQKVKDGIIEPKDVDGFLVEQELQTNCTGFPCPDLLIRTSGEQRLSNFLLWQLAYTELFFSHSHWPDFGETEFLEALCSFQQRQRRYGAQSS
ncbi:PREDICTED: dehydrodolichyl diphosphate synthase 2-like [Nicotiana attenuata]|uniref:Alkyl transferase n=1 Tax=Nicotiana attenuata TaxID=49451 RepID=A0A1J6I6I1_NICAT|nr:PREDICTED: dehydrodolichyl diphosphate synthase 2-like [Nicotiana attenuata]OIS96159.1 dehydrodolichyl diphosphate synthase 2 [Nicotiana attenuata]